MSTRGTSSPESRMKQVFRPHQFSDIEQYVDLYHVYDDLSCTPYQIGIGITSKEPVHSQSHPHLAITPDTMRKHLDWQNREPTQFISFYSSPEEAVREKERRRLDTFVPNCGYRKPDTVHIAHVRLLRGSDIFVFSRSEMLKMMAFSRPAAQQEMFRMSAPTEWFVWGDVPNHCVSNRHML